MNTLIATIHELVSDEMLIGLFAFSLVAFIGTLLAIPAILLKLPSDYFDANRPRVWMADHHPVVRAMGLCLKNGVGAVFLLAGFAMLFLPGQGLLTMIIGLSLLDFPGKRTIERKLMELPAIIRSINALRKKFGKAPFTFGERKSSSPHAGPL